MDRIRWFGLHTEINIYKVVQKIRQNRRSMVQTSAQYKFIYDAVACYVSAEETRLNGGESDSNMVLGENGRRGGTRKPIVRNNLGR